MVILGLMGAIGHGKTTLADDLSACAASAVHLESSDLIIEVANELRRSSGPLPDGDAIEAVNDWLQPLASILARQTKCRMTSAELALNPQRRRDHPAYYEKLFAYFTEQRKNPELQKAGITAHNKTMFRSLLQWLGGYLVKMADAGIWYDELLRRAAASKADLATIGGVRFVGDAERIRAAGGWVVNIVRPDMAAGDQTDLTERERALIKPDINVYNDADLAQLKAVAARLYKDLEGGKPAREYRASRSI